MVLDLIDLNSTDEEGWIPTNERFVGIIDIMGFKDMVYRKTPDEIHLSMWITLNALKGFEEQLKKMTKDGYTPIRAISFSDSFMIFTKDNSNSSLEQILYVLSGLTNTFFTQHIPFKGALAMGPMTLDLKNNIFFGRPLVDAFILQDEMLLYGIVLHGSVQNRIMNFPEIGEYNGYTAEYTVQFKNGSGKHLVVFSFFVLPSVAVPKDDIFHTIAHLENMRENTSGQLRKYIDNTIAFYENVMKSLNEETITLSRRTFHPRKNDTSESK